MNCQLGLRRKTIILVYVSGLKEQNLIKRWNKTLKMLTAMRKVLKAENKSFEFL